MEAESQLATSIFASLAALSAFRPDGLIGGMLALVAAPGIPCQVWQFQPIGGAAVNGTTVIAGQYGGQWWLAAPSGPVTGSSISGTYYIDPSMSLSTTSDSNDGRTTLSALATWRAFVQRIGTIAPLITQNLTIVFLSSHIDNTDPVIFRPMVGSGAVVSIQGAAPTLVATAILSGTVAKNRSAGSNSLLQTNLGASGAASKLLENTTHSSRCWSYKSLGSNNFSLSQPLVKCSQPPNTQTTSPAEVDAWVDGDSVNILAPVAVNLIEFSPTIVDFNSTQTNPATLYQLTVFDPQGAGHDKVYIGAHVLALECQFQRLVSVSPEASGNAFTVGAGGGQFGYPTFINCQWLGGFQFFGGVRIYAGSTQGFLTLGFSGPATAVFDADHINGGGMALYGGLFSVGFLYLDAGITLINTVKISLINGFYAGTTVYGSPGNNISMQAGSRISRVSGASYAAVLTAPALISPGIVINGSSSGYTVTAGTPPTWTSGVATTPANLDANGTIFTPGGATISTAV